MQLPLPLLRTRGSVTVVPLRSGAQTLPLKLVRNPRARRYVLRVTDQADVVVTLPRWGSVAQARAFAEQHLDWIAAERLRRMAASAAHSWLPGSDIWLRGERVPVVREEDRVRAGDVAVKAGEGRAAAEALRRALRETARRELPPRLLELAASARLRVARVTVRDQRSRWGSCSSRGSIALNWRLLLMPPAVRDYVLWHELMHLRRADHSPAFWKLVEEVCPEYRHARAWLLRHGKELA
jgi:predicted metal-dependent hydrolase